MPELRSYLDEIFIYEPAECMIRLKSNNIIVQVSL